MSSQELSKKQSSEVSDTNAVSSAMKTTTETVSSAAANLTGAFSFSGGLNAGAHSHKKTTTTTSSGGQQLSKQEADAQYEERMEEEYAKRGSDNPCFD
jgi:hypothetical protein